MASSVGRLTLALFAATLTIGAQPLEVSANGRYFVRDGKPFFWLGDTNWPIFTLYTAAEAEEYFSHRARQGFTVVHTMIVFNGGPGLNTGAQNQEGEAPFLNWNPATPNEAFFKNVDRVLEMARRNHLIVVIMPCGGSSGAFVSKEKIITAANVREYGRWLGRRYRNVPDIIWANGFDLKPSDHVDIAEALVAGLKEGDGGAHLITFHPAGGNSSSYFHDQSWLAFNIIQTWSDYWRIHPLVLADYCRAPSKPVVLAEGAYEAGTEYPTRPITPFIVRKQAYWAHLGGGFHSYGHNDMWRKNPTWRESLDAPGARHMTILKQVLAARDWWRLVPDQSVFAAGAGSDRDLNAAARSSRGDWAVVYLTTRNPVSIDLQKINAAKVQATWVNPETGETTPAGVFAASGHRSFTHSQQTDDALLILEAQRNRLLTRAAR